MQAISGAVQRVLLIIDPQVDFVTGSLAVHGAQEAMEQLAQWLGEHSRDYDTIVVTLDEHPYNHCSFVDQGGPWPPHCRRYTEGAAVYPPLAEMLHRLSCGGLPVLYIEKGCVADREEYSAFAHTVPTVLREAVQIDVAGIAGDYCVAESMRDLERVIPASRLRLLLPFIPYINPQ